MKIELLKEFETRMENTSIYTLEKSVLKNVLKVFKSLNCKIDNVSILKECLQYCKDYEPSYYNYVSMFNRYKKEILDLVNTNVENEIIEIDDNKIIIYNSEFEINDYTLIKNKFTKEEKENLFLYTYDKIIDRFLLDIDFYCVGCNN